MMREDGDARPWAASQPGAPRPPVEAFARHDRRNPTDAERKLWLHLRRLDVMGTHFRRQVVIHPFIADFACRGARLIVEVDGAQHAENPLDADRTARLEAAGWRVLRFWNNDVLSNIEGVMETIAAALTPASGGSFGTTPTPDPSPQGGGGT